MEFKALLGHKVLVYWSNSEQGKKPYLEAVFHGIDNSNYVFETTAGILFVPFHSVKYILDKKD